MFLLNYIQPNNATTIHKMFVFFATRIVLLLLVLSSCSTKEPSNPTEEIPTSGTLSPTVSVYFEADKSAQLLVITTTEAWTISSTSTWIDFTTRSGSGKTSLLVGATKNDGFGRIDSFEIQTAKTKQKIHLTQSGADIVSIRVVSEELHFIKVAGGTFNMGENNSWQQHEVNVSPYYISQTEVSNALWQKITGSLPYAETAKNYPYSDDALYPNYPVTAVSWNDINTSFLPLLQEATQLAVRLPTEAEWEYAAMGGNLSKEFEFAGSNDSEEVGWELTNSSGTKHEIGQLKPNELGIYDMSGNAAEWCSDWYADSYNTESANNPQGASTGTYRVIRGGNIKSERLIMGYHPCRVKQRFYSQPSGYQGAWGDTGHPDEPIQYVCNEVGFRLVLSIK